MGISIENKAKNKRSLKKALSDGPSANLRPLHNSHVAKVYIVKWSQIFISTSGSFISGIPKIFNNFFLNSFSKKYLLGQ